MNKKNRNSIQSILVTFALLLCFSLSAQTTLSKVTPDQVGMSSSRLQHLTNVMQDYIDKDQISGSVVLVARQGKVAYFKAFGQSDLENNQVMKENSIFRIASQSKAIISVGIMMLQEEGKLLINHPLGNYIPAFQNTTVAVKKEDAEDENAYEVVNAKRPITIRDLLTHTAGIGYGYGIGSDQWKAAGIQGWYFADREEPIQKTVERMASLPFEAQPGEKFVYGYNTDILGALIEVISGQPLDKFLKSRILDPLGMKDTHFYLPKDKTKRLATVYSATEEGIKRAPNPGLMVGQGAYIDGPRTSFSGGAGYLSTAMDYAVFLQMLLNGGTYNGQRILSRKSVELMTTSHIGDEAFPWAGGTGFGLGFSICEDLGKRGKLGSEGEFAWGGAYHSVYWVDPVEELIVVYFTQLIPADSIDDHDKLRALIYQSIVD